MQQRLTLDDTAMIERVLAKAGLRKRNVGSMMDLDAARFLARKFQDGVTNEADLALALERYVTMRGARGSNAAAAEKLSALT